MAIKKLLLLSCLATPSFAGANAIYHENCVLELDEDVLTLFGSSKQETYKNFSEKGYKVATVEVSAEGFNYFILEAEDNQLQLDQVIDGKARCYVSSVSLPGDPNTRNGSLSQKEQQDLLSKLPTCSTDKN